MFTTFSITLSFIDELYSLVHFLQNFFFGGINVLKRNDNNDRSSYKRWRNKPKHPQQLYAQWCFQLFVTKCMCIIVVFNFLHVKKNFCSGTGVNFIMSPTALLLFAFRCVALLYFQIFTQHILSVQQNSTRSLYKFLFPEPCILFLASSYLCNPCKQAKIKA